MELRILLKSSGLRNFTKLLSANVIAQVIGLVVYPILTRTYTPEDFGLLNLFLSIGGVLVIWSTKEYYYAIVLPKTKQESVSVLLLCVCLLLLTVGLTTIFVLFSTEIATLFKTPKLADYFWMMPILVLALGGWNILNYWYIRCSQYNRISNYQLTQSVLSAGGKLGFGYAGVLHGGMIYAMVIAPTISLLINVFAIRKTIKDCCIPSWTKIRDVARKYSNFPCFSLPRSFINMLAGQLPILILTPIFGAEHVGWWSMAILLGFTPISVIARSIYQVMYQYTTDRVNKNLPIHKYFCRFTWLVVMLGVPFLSILCYFMLDLTVLVLGTGWEETGVYLRWMLPWVLCNLLTGSVGFLADIFFKQKVGLIFEILTSVLRTLGVVLGIIFEDFKLSIIGYSIGTAVAVAAQYVWLLSLTRRYDATLTSLSDASTDGSEI